MERDYYMNSEESLTFEKQPISSEYAFATSIPPMNSSKRSAKAGFPSFRQARGQRIEK